MLKINCTCKKLQRNTRVIHSLKLCRIYDEEITMNCSHLQNCITDLFHCMIGIKATVQTFSHNIQRGHPSTKFQNSRQEISLKRLCTHVQT